MSHKINFSEVLEPILNNKILTLDKLLSLCRISKTIKEIIDKIQPFAKVCFYTNHIGVYIFKLLIISKRFNIIILSLNNFIKNDRLFYFNRELNREQQQELYRLIELISHCGNLKYLNLSNNDIGLADIDSLNSFSNVLAQCQKLLELKLNNNFIRDEEIIILAPVLKHYRELTIFAISNNQIGPNGAESISRELSQCITLKRFDISNNQIGPDGAESISRVLSQCKELTHFAISNNQIGPDGAESISIVLPFCRTLTSLDLSKNNLGSDGAKCLSRVLPQCEVLSELKLMYNKISGIGAKNLIEVLPQCISLKRFDISYNKLYYQGGNSIFQVLSHCHKLIHLNISYNYISSEIISIIYEKYSKNINLEYIHSQKLKW